MKTKRREGYPEHNKWCWVQLVVLSILPDAQKRGTAKLSAVYLLRFYYTRIFRKTQSLCEKMPPMPLFFPILRIFHLSAENLMSENTNERPAIKSQALKWNNQEEIWGFFGGVGWYGLFSLRITKMMLHSFRATPPTAVKWCFPLALRDW